MSISRRKLLAGSGASALGIAGLSHAGGMQSSSPETATLVPTQWDDEVDVVVVGSGAAALTAAITAHDAGANVLILEKAKNPGGTSILAFGVTVFNNTKMRELGLEDPREDAIRVMARASYPSLYDPEVEYFGLHEADYELIEAFYDNSSPTFELLDRVGALKTMIQPTFGFSEKPEISDPDYYADMPENKAPYGRGLTGAGEDPAKSHYLMQMLAYVEKQEIPIRTGHRVESIHQNSLGEIVGVTATTEGGDVHVRAHKGVVFGTGGFTQDPEKALNYLKGPIYGGCGVPTNTGDFIDIAAQAGARLGNLNNAFWVEMVLERALESPSTTSEVWLPFGDSMVLVNKYGKRVVNEKMVYNERTQVHFHWDPSRREFKNQILYMIWDSAVAENPSDWPYRYPVPMPGKKSPDVIKGETWDELIDNINARLESLAGKSTVSGRVPHGYRLEDNFSETFAHTLGTFNQYAENGVDLEFQRGETPVELAWATGPPREEGMANPSMAPFSETGPYYCVIVGGGTLDTNGGPVVTAKAEVVNTRDEPIVGLYGAGNCIASPTGQAYFSTLGPAMTFGFIAGTEVAASSDHSAD